MFRHLFRSIAFGSRFNTTRWMKTSKDHLSEPLTKKPSSADPRTTIKCWSCHHFTPLDRVFCINTQCTKIQKPHEKVSYFDVLLGSESFDIDLKFLRRQFLALQQKCHPDSTAGESGTEKDYASLQSSWLNKAYSTLKIPLQRAIYLLSLHGRSLGEDASISDPELLMEVLERREEIEDEATTQSRISEMVEMVETDIRNVETSLARLWSRIHRTNNLSIDEKAKVLEEIMDETIRLKYFATLLEACQARSVK